MFEKATFAAGCFWGVESKFRSFYGVLDAKVGYTGGHTKNPTYKEVCSGETGHAEAIEILFDPRKIKYEKLLDEFWQMHNPTTLNRQGPDRGSQYRSAIFFHSLEQERLAKESKVKLERLGVYRGPIVTEIVEAGVFYPAEDYHQRYHEKNGGSCGI